MQQLPPDLVGQTEMLMTESWTEPYSIELPGLCDILVPNLPRLDESPLMNHLNYIQPMREYEVSPHAKVFGKEKVTLGSLNAEIEVIELKIAEDVYDEEQRVGIERVLEKLKISQQQNLFVTFRY